MRTVYITLGDSASDLLLAKPFHKSKVPFAFYFVGNPTKAFWEKVKSVFGSHPPTVFATDRRFARGTRRVLAPDITKSNKSVRRIGRTRVSPRKSRPIRKPGK